MDSSFILSPEAERRLPARLAKARAQGLPVVTMAGREVVAAPREGPRCPACGLNTTEAPCDDPWHAPRFLGDPRRLRAEKRCARRGHHDYVYFTSDPRTGRGVVVRRRDQALGRVCACGAWDRF